MPPCLAKRPSQTPEQDDAIPLLAGGTQVKPSQTNVMSTPDASTAPPAAPPASVAKDEPAEETDDAPSTRASAYGQQTAHHMSASLADTACDHWTPAPKSSAPVFNDGVAHGRPPASDVSSPRARSPSATGCTAGHDRPRKEAAKTDTPDGQTSTLTVALAAMSRLLIAQLRATPPIHSRRRYPATLIPRLLMQPTLMRRC